MSSIWQRLAEEKNIGPELRAEIERVFGTRGKKALAAIDDGKVIRYLDFLVVEGRTARYVVEEDFCTCSDFMYRGRICWHLLAARMAIASGTFRTEHSWYQDQLRSTPRQTHE